MSTAKKTRTIEVEISQERFDEKLRDVLMGEGNWASASGVVDRVLAIPGVYELLAEEYNNEVIAAIRADIENSEEEGPQSA